MSSRLGIAGIVLLAAFGLAACGGGGTADTEPPPPTQAELDAQARADLEAEIAALRTQLGLPADGDVSGGIADLMAERDSLKKQVEDAEEAEEMARMEAERMAAEAAAAAMAVTAAKLYTGISAPTATDTNADGNRFARHADPNGANAGDIEVAINNAADVFLSEDEDATVATHRGWQGQRFTRTMPAAEGTYEAVVYSNVGEPTEGAKFNDSANGGYTLNADNQIADVTSVTDYAGLVDSPSFDQSAGTKTFDLAENREYLEFTGTFNGVPGTYTCVPTAIATDRDTCGSTVAASGFTLIGGTWTFEPNDPEQRLMNMPDAIYASYGWWLHKAADNGAFTASAFAANRGNVAAATGIDTLQGSARYTGGAAGKYALHSTTGGRNDAGHFTADVTLDANFNTDMVSGTVDNFTGADGEARDWSVTLKPSGVGDTGTILGADGTGDQMMTVWTIGGEAADAAGGWQGSLQDNGDDGVPKVATGTFYTEFGRDGKMVGGFGANRE